MISSNWLYEIILLLHALSLIGYIVYFIYSNWKMKKIAFSLFVIVWTVHTAGIAYELIITKAFPILNLNDGIYFYAWTLLTFTLIINRIYQVHFIVLLTNIFSFFTMTLAVTLSIEQHSAVRSTQLIHEILMAHITLSILSYGFFTVSFLLAVMYLIQYHLLKRKKGLKSMWRFTNLEQLDQYSHLSVVIGVPLLLLGLILGVVWAYVSGEDFYWYDLKTIGSIILLCIYSIYLIVRNGNIYNSKSISIFSSATFLMLLVNFFLFSVLSNFHF